ncbi:MAG: hypothetical protein JWO47_35 [Candidatus Saccharibacteria bacterium]|nr:hypothetical protein [Candidatus Saccharibacteria bacterium]
MYLPGVDRGHIIYIRDRLQEIDRDRELQTIQWSFSGIPDLSVHDVAPDICETVNKDRMNKVPLGMYPLVGVIPYMHPNRMLGASMVLKLPRLGKMGVHILDVCELNEIGAAVGGFAEFEWVKKVI